MTSLLVHQLRGPLGARPKKPKRLGRGPGSGHGKTAGRGHKGQKARNGGGKPRLGFEGGQNSMLRRLPKFGFTNIFRVSYQAVALKSLEALGLSDVTLEILKEKRIISSLRRPIKLLGGKDIKLPKGIKVQAHAVSASARAAIEGAGGQIQEMKA